MVATLEVPPAMEGASDGDAPRWPDEAAESAFLSEQRDSGTPAALLTVPKASNEGERTEAEDNSPLPPLQSLIDRIPPEARETLEDLFRARFVSVKRVHNSALKGK